MEIRYSVAQDDLWRSRREIMFSNSRARAILIIGMPVMLLILAIPLVGHSQHTSLPVLIWLFSGVVAFVAFAFGFPDRFQPPPNGGKGILGEHRLVVREDGIEESTEFNRDQRPWTAISQITRSTRFIYIITETRNFYVIPIRELAPGIADAFFEKAQSYWSAKSVIARNDNALLKPEISKQQERLFRWMPVLLAATVGLSLEMWSLTSPGKAGSALATPGRALARALWNHPPYESPDFLKALVTMSATNTLLWSVVTYIFIRTAMMLINAGNKS